LFARSWHGETFDVYVLAPEEKRLADLRQAARQVVSELRWSQYHFATTAILDPARFATDGWLGLDDTWRPILNDYREISSVSASTNTTSHPLISVALRVESGRASGRGSTRKETRCRSTGGPTWPN
jgi:hypothetical protein